jgi:NTP pyrophosphatase (non-canonical NTP hydrolase)
MNSEISIKKLQEAIKNIDHKNNAVDKYFYKLSEEVGELAKVIRKNQRLSDTGDIKDTIEEELQDVLYYVVCLANIYDIDLEQCIYLKEQINAKKYDRKSMFE